MVLPASSRLAVLLNAVKPSDQSIKCEPANCIFGVDLARRRNVRLRGVWQARRCALAGGEAPARACIGERTAPVAESVEGAR